jgi:hypothetical protein
MLRLFITLPAPTHNPPRTPDLQQQGTCFVLGHDFSRAVNVVE